MAAPLALSEEDQELVVAEVCGHLARGEPMTVICQRDGMPSVTTLWAWGQALPAIAEAIAAARDAGLDRLAYSAQMTAQGFGPERGGKSTKDVQRDKLIVDTDLKLLSKWAPKRYGDAVQLKHADADGEKIDSAPLISELMGLLRGKAAD